MAGPLAGLAGLYGPVDPEAHGNTRRDPSNWGGPVDKTHAIPGDAVHPLPTKAAQYPQDPSLLASSGVPLGGIAGEVHDRTPNVHSAPTIRGIETDPVRAAEQSVALHSIDLGGSSVTRHAPMHYPVTVDSGMVLSPEQSILEATPQQLRAGSLDVDQGDGHNNSGTFGYGHQQHRTYKDPVPLDTSLINPADRPFYGKHPVRQNLLNGDGSPYAQAGDISVGMSLGPTPVSDPTPYQAPPDPTVSPVVGYPQAVPVADYGWVQI